MICPNCKNELIYTSKYCKYCGYKLVQEKKKNIFYVILILSLILFFGLIKTLSIKKDPLPVGMLTETVSVQQVQDTLRNLKHKGITDPYSHIANIYSQYGREVGDKFDISNDDKLVIYLYGKIVPIETRAINEVLEFERNKRRYESLSEKEKSY